MLISNDKYKEEEKYFLNEVKNKLKIDFGYFIDTYSSTPKEINFVRKHNDYYECVLLSKEKNMPGSFIISVFTSKVITSAKFNYGTMNTYHKEWLFSGEYKPLEINFFDGTFPLPSRFLPKFKTIDETMAFFWNRFEYTDKFYKDSQLNLERDQIVSIKLNYIHRLAEDFEKNWPIYEPLTEQEYLNLILMEFNDKIIERMKGRITHSDLTKKSIIHYYDTTIIWNKSFDKKLKISTDKKYKFWAYCVLYNYTPSGHEEIDRFLRHNRETGDFGSIGAMCYASLMTYIEKAY